MCLGYKGLRRRWEDSSKMDLKAIGINTRNWVDSAEDNDYWRALVNAALNLQISKAIKLGYKVYFFLRNNLRYDFQSSITSQLNLPDDVHINRQ